MSATGLYNIENKHKFHRISTYYVFIALDLLLFDKAKNTHAPAGEYESEITFVLISCNCRIVLSNPKITWVLKRTLRRHLLKCIGIADPMELRKVEIF